MVTLKQTNGESDVLLYYEIVLASSSYGNGRLIDWLIGF